VLHPLLSEVGAKLPKQHDLDQKRCATLRKAEKNARKMQDAALDRQTINSRALRAQRVEALTALQEIQDESVPMLTGGSAAAALPGVDEGQQPPAAAKKGLSRVPDGAVPSEMQPEEPEGEAGEQAELKNKPRSCYSCKKRFRVLHHFYDSFCPSCAELNWSKRIGKADLTGKVILLTGARVKIGFQACVKLLQCGAHVIATTRFPHDLAIRFGALDGFVDWGSRLEVYGIDLRDIKAVEALAQHLIQTQPRLDAIVNNACQTVRRPPAYYAHLMANERASLDQLPPQKYT
jgi:cytochrome c556